MPAASVTYSFTSGGLIKSNEVNQNFTDLTTWMNTNAIQKDASVAFTGVPSGPATDPSSANQFTRKQYVDDRRGPKVLALHNINTGVAPSLGSGSYYTVITSSGLTFTADHYYEADFYLPNVYLASVAGAQVFGTMSVMGLEVVASHFYQTDVGQGCEIQGRQSWYQSSTLSGQTVLVRIKHAYGGTATLNCDAATYNQMRLTIKDLGKA